MAAGTGFRHLAVAAAALLPALLASAATLEKVKQRGTLECGVSEGFYGFS